MADKTVFDFVDSHGANAIEEWLNGYRGSLRGRMKAKIDALISAESELPPKMLTDTSKRQIKELCVNGDVALRLLLCRGPIDMTPNSEFTLLYGAEERDRKYVPRNALERAEERRQLVLSNPGQHRIRRNNADSKKSS